MKPRALVTRHVYPAAIPILQEHCAVDYHDSYEVLSEQRLMRRLALADGVVSQLTDPLTRAVIESAPKLKVISQVAVGYDNIDVAAATERGVVVTNTPGCSPKPPPTSPSRSSWRRHASCQQPSAICVPGSGSAGTSTCSVEATSTVKLSGSLA